jgi:hypothetical protein
MNETNQAAPIKDTAKKAGMYVAFELSRKKWKMGISDGKTMRARVVSIEARDWTRMKQELEKARERFGLEADAPVRSCYEAGREGFWIHRDRRGIDGCEAEEEGKDGSDRCGGAGEAIDSILARGTRRLERGEGAQ